MAFWKFFDAEDTESGEVTKSRKIPMARDYWVFNAEQVDGYTPVDQPKVSLEERIESAEPSLEVLELT